MSRNLKWYNFWSRYDGMLYGWRAYHPTTGRLVFVYGGKTFQRFETRISQHAWGGGRYDDKPKPWADTVPGWRPNGTPKEIIAAGGVFPILGPRKISPWGLWWREIVFAIWLRRPLYNHMWNLGNPRRITISEQYRQREARDRGQQFSGVGTVGRAVYWWASVRRMVTMSMMAVSLLGVGVLFLPGMPAANLAVEVWDWVVGNARELGLLILLGCSALMFTGKPTRTRRRRRSTRR